MTADIADLRVERIDAKDTFRNNGSSNHFNAFRGRLQQFHESGDALDAGPPLSREISPRSFLSVSPYSLAVSVIGARSADPGRMSRNRHQGTLNQVVDLGGIANAIRGGLGEKGGENRDEPAEKVPCALLVLRFRSCTTYSSLNLVHARDCGCGARR